MNGLLGEPPRWAILGGSREISRRDRGALGETSHQSDSAGVADRGHLRRPVLARLDLWQRAARPALSRWLGAGWRHGLATLSPRRRQDGQPVAEIGRALAKDPCLRRLPADRRLRLAFGFLTPGHQLRMGFVGGLRDADAERHCRHLSRLVAAGQSRHGRARRV